MPSPVIPFEGLSIPSGELTVPLLSNLDASEERVEADPSTPIATIWDIKSRVEFLQNSCKHARSQCPGPKQQDKAFHLDEELEGLSSLAQQLEGV